MSLCEQLIGGSYLEAKRKSIIDRCTAPVYRGYQQSNYEGAVPTLQDFRQELLKQDEPEAQEIALRLLSRGTFQGWEKSDGKTTIDA